MWTGAGDEMSAHPVFFSPSHPKKRGRYRLEWPALTTTTATPAPETTTMDPEPDSEPPEPAGARGRPGDMEPPDPDPEVQGAFVTGWRVLTRGSEARAMDDAFSQVRVPLYQQSVTLTAKMWPEEGERTEPGPGGGGGWAAWRVSGDHLPLVVGGAAGGALIVMLVVAAVVWRLCVLRRDKQYRIRTGEGAPEPRATHPTQPVAPSESAVFASPVSGRWAYRSRLLSSPPGGDCSPGGTSTPPAGPRSPALRGAPSPLPAQPPQAWVYGDAVACDPSSLPRAASASPCVHRSVSLQLAHQQSPQGGSLRRGLCRPQCRPLSVISSLGSQSACCSPAASRHSAANLPPPPPEFLLPEICEFNPGAAGTSVVGAHPSVQYASSSVLDDTASMEENEEEGEALRTRSLPSSVKNRQRPLASEEDLDQLYARVNFSKKRKNRMRHDEAAIIAISKSRSQFLDKMVADNDTLVENEAVIVYNERTAL